MSVNTFDIELWAEACEKAARALENCEGHPDDLKFGYAMDEIDSLRALLYHMEGIACTKCAGVGSRAYGDTSTWMGGVGGQQITSGICDKCWGTGRSDRTGPNLRRICGGNYPEGS